MTPLSAARQAIELRKKATQGEWHAATHDEAGGALVLCDTEGGSLAGFDPCGPWVTEEQAFADLEFTAHAANTYAAVAEALIEATEFLLKYGRHMNYCQYTPAGTGETAKAAIGKCTCGLAKSQGEKDPTT